jgi:hypothetical protein
MTKETSFLKAIGNFVDHPTIKLLMIVVAVVGLIITVLSLRRKYFKKRIIIENQHIEGSNNVVSGGDTRKGKHQISSTEKEIKIKQQIVVGNGNKVAGGDINE